MELNFSVLPCRYDAVLELFYSSNFDIISFGSGGQHPQAMISMKLSSGHCLMVSSSSSLDCAAAEVLQASQPKKIA